MVDIIQHLWEIVVVTLVFTEQNQVFGATTILLVTMVLGFVDLLL